jgi:hypothetical protein
LKKPLKHGIKKRVNTGGFEREMIEFYGNKMNSMYSFKTATQYIKNIIAK